MNRASAKVWSHSEGPHRCRVRVYERRPGGLLYLSAFDPLLAGGKGGFKRVALGHRDKKAAMKEARRVAAALEAGHRKNPSIAVLERIAKALGVPVGKLLG